MRPLNVLVACEESGAVRDAFIALGHNAISCDLIPTSNPGPHWQGDVMEILYAGWDLMIAHPPCTYLTSSGLHWNKRRPGRATLTEEALAFVRVLLGAPIPKIALENPVGCISSRIRKPEQIIQPYDFGDDASKATCLWLKGLPLLRGTKFVAPRMVCGCGHTFRTGSVDKYGCPNCEREHVALPRWANQTDSGQNVLGPSDERQRERSKTYPGIAAAIADQWGGLVA